MALSRGYTSDYLLAQVMRFFQISSRPQRERVATRVTNSSEFGDKLKAERIAHFKRLFLRHRIFCLRPPGKKLRKFQFWRLFSCDFFHLSRRQFERGYTCDFHLALATRQNLKKSHHLREQKIARVAAALAPTSLLKLSDRASELVIGRS